MKEDLLLRILTGEATSTEKRGFYRLLANNKKEEELFYEVKSLWLRASMQNNIINADSEFESLWRRIKQKKGQTPFSIGKRIIRYAAIIIFILSLGSLTGYFILKNNFDYFDFEPQKFTSTKGSVSIIEFPDGTKIWLNSDSKLTFREDHKTKERFAELIGEAYFDVVKKENNKHFYVQTSDIKIEVLGTEFNVKSYPEEGVIETTLEEGEIVLYKNTPNGDTKITTLLPNQHAIFIKKEGEIYLDQLTEEKQPEKLKNIERREQLLISENINTEKYVAWKDGSLIIDGESFESFVNKMERWYDVQIEIKNEKLKKLHFTANFKNETVEQALQALKTAHPFNYTFDVDKNLILIK